VTAHSGFGTPVADIEDYFGTETTASPEVDAKPAPSLPDRRAPRLTKRLIITVATAAVIAAAAGLWATRVAPTPAPSTAPAPPAGVDGFAELFIATYLTRGGDDGQSLETFMAPEPGIAAMTPLGRYVTRAATLEIQTRGGNYWDVTVATEVLDRTEHGYVSAGIEHYQIAVMKFEDQLIVADLPARVAGPSAPMTPPITPLANEVDVELAEFTAEFLDAMLVGSHRLSRYTVAGSDIRAIEPYPYQMIALSELASGVIDDRTYVRAIVNATTPGGMVHVVAYTLELSGDSGDWEVAAIRPGPPPQQGSSTP
jgi:hypothetical protein